MILLVMAFVLINTKIGSEKETSEALRGIPEVKVAYNVYGLYDISRARAQDIKTTK